MTLTLLALLVISHSPIGRLAPLSHLFSHMASPLMKERHLLLKNPVSFPRPLQLANSSQVAGGPVQVGAWGDLDSVGNRGVQVEIQTNAYNITNQAEDAFWVGDVLKDGSFVQAGYVILSPGVYCLTAHIMSNGTSCLGSGDSFASSDARWFWAYFPDAQNVNDWYYGFGPANSAGSNGTGSSEIGRLRRLAAALAIREMSAARSSLQLIGHMLTTLVARPSAF
jgi:hypothetical protein